jgi:hypothetical protein
MQLGQNAVAAGQNYVQQNVLLVLFLLQPHSDPLFFKS